MITGHIGLAFVARGADRRTKLPWFLAASLLPDATDGAYAMLKFCSPDGAYSHSLPAIAGLAALMALVAHLSTGSGRTALITGLLVLAHPPLDYITGAKALWLDGPIAGLGIYRWPVVDFALELPIVALGWWVLRRAGRDPKWLRSAAALTALVALQASGDIFLSYVRPGWVPTGCPGARQAHFLPV